MDQDSVFPRRKINDISDDHQLPVVPTTHVIPKIIHQAFIGVLPECIKDIAQRLRDQNPDFIYKFYDEDAMKKFVADNYGEVILSYFNRINIGYSAARSDLFRYLVIYKEGGIYLDVKSMLTYPASRLVINTKKYLLCNWDNRAGEAHAGYGWHTEVAKIEEGELQQWHVVSVPGHPFLRAVINAVLTNIDYYRPWRDEVGQRGTMRLTGPAVYTLTILNIKDKFEHSYFRTGVEAGLIYSALESSTAHRILLQDYRWQTQSVVNFENPLLRGASALYSWVIGPIFMLRKLRIRLKVACQVTR
jgi:inositol phosphorylceramide mannosyltransferase catalytic subunit